MYNLISVPELLGGKTINEAIKLMDFKLICLMR